MYIVVIKNKVKENCEEAYYEVSKRFAEDMKQVEGCQDAYVLKSLEQKDVIVNVEHWASKEAKEADNGSVFLKYKSELKPLFLSNSAEEYEK